MIHTTADHRSLAVHGYAYKETDEETTAHYPSPLCKRCQLLTASGLTLRSDAGYTRERRQRKENDMRGSGLIWTIVGILLIIALLIWIFSVM